MHLGKQIVYRQGGMNSVTSKWSVVVNIKSKQRFKKLQFDKTLVFNQFWMDCASNKRELFSGLSKWGCFELKDGY